MATRGADALRALPQAGNPEWQTARVQFDAASPGLPELGYMVENSVLQLALWQRLQEQPVTLFAPAKLQTLEQHSGGWRLGLADGQQLTARLVIGADGANSQVRQLTGIGIQGWNYSQSCMLISVELDHDAGDTTAALYAGRPARAVAALWPLGVVGLVRSSGAHPPAAVAAAGAAAKEVARCFPARLGRFRVQQAASFPLVRRHANHYVLPGWRWSATRRTPLIRWRGRALISAIAMSTR